MLDRHQLDSIPVCAQALQVVPEAFAREWCVLAVSIDDGKLHLIVPSNVHELISADTSGLDKIRFVLAREFSYDVAEKDELRRIVDLHYWAAYSEIRNCEVQFQAKCPKQWIDLKPTDQNSVRFCSECRKNVYFCRWPEELKQRAENYQCVAFCDADTQEVMLGLPNEILD